MNISKLQTIGLLNKKWHIYGFYISTCFLVKQCSVYLHFIGNAAPGAPGGGASPSVVGAGAATPQTLAKALTLVPPGLTPIAVFPPYNTPRTIPAVSVTFSEDPNIRYTLSQSETGNFCLI